MALWRGDSVTKRNSNREGYIDALTVFNDFLAQISWYNVSEKKKALYLRVDVLSTKSLIGDTIFLRLLLETGRDSHFTWSSEPREGLAICRAKTVPPFLSHFIYRFVGPGWGLKEYFPFHFALFFFKNKLYPASVIHFGCQEKRGKKVCFGVLYVVQWNLCLGDTLGTEESVPWMEVSPE